MKHDCAGNLPPMPAIFPDQMAPIVRVRADGEREPVMARWDMPGPFRRTAGDKYPERGEHALAHLAGSGKSMRGARDVVLRVRGHPAAQDADLVRFLTTDANAIVAPIHPKAMPVILTTPAEVDRWLGSETPDALALQAPLPIEALRIVAKGERSGGVLLTA